MTRVALRLYMIGGFLLLSAIVTRVLQITAGAPDSEQIIPLTQAATGWLTILVGHVVEAIERKGDA